MTKHDLFALIGMRENQTFLNILEPQRQQDKQKDTLTGSLIITKSITDKISAWYRGRAFLFDNNIADDDELEDLLYVIEKAVQQQGIDLILPGKTSQTP